MLINPEIEEWFSKLQGQSRGGSGGSPGHPVAGLGSDALSGIVHPGSGMFGFSAPPIRSNYRPTPIAPSPPERSPSGIPPVAPSSQGSGSRDLGGGAIAAGLGKLGQGIETGLKGFAERRRANAAAEAGRPTAPSEFMSRNPGATMPGPLGPLSRQMQNNPGATMPSPAPAIPTFSPIGGTSETPLLAHPGAGIGETGTSIGPAGSLPTLAAGAPGGDKMAAYREAIASNESRGSGDYSAIGPVTRSGDKAYGRYQVMGENVPAWTKAATGTAMTPQQFLADKGAQNAVFDQQFGQAVQKYGQDGAVNWWFTGKPNPPPTANDQYTTAPEYLRKFNAALGGQAPPMTAPSEAAYAAKAPVAGGQPELAGPLPQQDTPLPPQRPGQEVTPGQTDPHKPGFDPSSVPFHDYSGQHSSMNEPGDLQRGMQQERDYFSSPQGPPVSPDMPKSLAPLPERQFPPGGADVADNGMNPLAIALAQNEPNRQLDQSALLAMALAQPDISAPPIDFGGGMFGGLFS